jgi:hypothetical protein
MSDIGGGNATKGASPERNLDFSGDTVSPRNERPLALGPEYDPRPLEDNARRRIAYWLITLLTVTVVWTLCLISTGAIKISDLKEMSVFLTPIFTLVSAATGFYYGTKQTR